MDGAPHVMSVAVGEIPASVC
ncbi:hypothetical protein BOS5A_80029 [Bosea sp. EC-HK365B]|nr:hypothetical protein BOSE21B_111423 [Bosea sp. 21B]VVT62369.1 hypothetical protein BOS5A_80029 [Bosea sp. EC-HK365B]VXC66147.1 hypothetical protein BOSE127_30232 [Bosea sp. 127]